ncbi:unnamed protein product [Cylicostephanus goldi]|uniref:Uncharacterized protein n=1 Tax=Cylicostephanus goldi TaxID=71465 RepID=A0A3P6SS01_CYLGO|nr:unnamed protein product [Cylicostephanus goldi]
MFEATLSEPYELVKPTQPNAKAIPSLDPKSRVLIERVKTFFEELKRRLGNECRRTIFNSPGKLTALACGVHEATVYRVAKTQAGMVHRPIPRTKHVERNPRQRRRDALQKYGDQWGSVVRHFIHDKLRAERHVTVEDAWKELGEIHEGFRMSQTEFRDETTMD